MALDKALQHGDMCIVEYTLRETVEPSTERNILQVPSSLEGLRQMPRGNWSPSS